MSLFVQAGLIPLGKRSRNLPRRAEKISVALVRHGMRASVPLVTAALALRDSKRALYPFHARTLHLLRLIVQATGGSGEISPTSLVEDAKRWLREFRKVPTHIQAERVFKRANDIMREVALEPFAADTHRGTLHLKAADAIDALVAALSLAALSLTAPHGKNCVVLWDQDVKTPSMGMFHRKSVQALGFGDNLAML